MAARSKRSGSSFLTFVVLVAVIVGGYFLLKGKPITSNKSTSTVTTKSPAQKTTTSTTAVASASSGPVGRNALRAYAGPGKGEITLEWQRFFADGENFTVKYGVKSKEYAYSAPYVGYISTYTIKGLTPGTKYYFAIEGIRTGNISAGTDGEVSMVAPSVPTTVVGTMGPVGRNSLTAKVGPKKGQVTLSWIRNNPDTEQFHIVYGTLPGKFSYGLLNAVTTVPGTNNYSYVIGSLTSGTRYFFALEPQRYGQGLFISSEVSAVAP